jgi:hypothetical protein
MASSNPGQREPLFPGTANIRVAHSELTETRAAIHELLDKLTADRAEMTFVFFSPSHRADVISDVMDERTGANGVGGTTGGELSDAGFTRGTMTGMSLHAPGAQATAEVIPNLQQLSLVPLVDLPNQFARRLDRDPGTLDPTQHLWLLFADGRSGAESLITPFFMQEAPSKGLVGGSLVGETPTTPARAVYHGRVYEDAALLVLLEYEPPFETFYHSHMELTDRVFEVTGVSDQGRLLEALDGRPAAEVYAETLGVPVEELTRQHLAHHPLGFRFRGRAHTCSPVDKLSNGGLLMGNALHPGDELHWMEPGDLVESTRGALAEARRDFEAAHQTPPRAGLMFHCLGRYLEAEADGTVEELGAALTQLPITGFNSLGEQLDALHTNHSLTGLLLG